MSPDEFLAVFRHMRLGARSQKKSSTLNLSRFFGGRADLALKLHSMHGQPSLNPGLGRKAWSHVWDLQRPPSACVEELREPARRLYRPRLKSTLGRSDLRKLSRAFWPAMILMNRSPRTSLTFSPLAVL